MLPCIPISYLVNYLSSSHRCCCFVFRPISLPFPLFPFPLSWSMGPWVLLPVMDLGWTTVRIKYPLLLFSSESSVSMDKSVPPVTCLLDVFFFLTLQDCATWNENFSFVKNLMNLVQFFSKNRLSRAESWDISCCKQGTRSTGQHRVLQQKQMFQHYSLEGMLTTSTSSKTFSIYLFSGFQHNSHNPGTSSHSLQEPVSA